jgi:hypothetical protein
MFIMSFLNERNSLKFSGFACILLTENQLINALLSSSKEAITFSKVLSDFDKVLSSALWQYLT